MQNTSLSPLGPGLCQEQCGITVSKYGDILLDQDLCPGRRDNFTANQAQINSWSNQCLKLNETENPDMCSKGSLTDATYCGECDIKVEFTDLFAKSTFF